MDWLNPREAGPDQPQAQAEPSILDRKRPGRFPDSFSSNLGRNTSSYFSQEQSSGLDEEIHSLPENQSIINRKRDVIVGIPPPLPTPRNRQVSAASSVKAMVAKFESDGGTPEKPDQMADAADLIPSSPVVDQTRGKASIDTSIDITTCSSACVVGHPSQPTQQQNIHHKSLNAEEGELELLKMQEFLKTEPLARCLDDYVPPKRRDEKVVIYPLENDEGKSMSQAAKLELHNKLVEFHEIFEKRHPNAKTERLEKEAAAELLKAGHSAESVVSSAAPDDGTKASCRAGKKAQKKADKRAEKVAKRENAYEPTTTNNEHVDTADSCTEETTIHSDDDSRTLNESRETAVASSSQGAPKQSGADGESFTFIQRDPEEVDAF